MSTRRYRMLSALVAAALTAAALVGCGSSVRTGTTPQAGAGSSSATGVPSTGPVAPSPAGGVPGASGVPGGGAAGGGGAEPGPGRTGGGAGTAKPAPLSSLTCGAVTTVPGRLPDRDWTEAASCPVDAPRPGDGGPVNQPGVPIVKRGDLAPLVRALNQPDAPRTHGICPDYRVLMPTFWLVDSTGQAYQPHVPVNSCGQPSAAVLSALRALGLN
jgi:hypothetical protein